MSGAGRSDGAPAGGPGDEGRTLTLDEVADRVGGRVVGDGSVRVAGLAPLEEAGDDRLALLGDRRYLRHLAETGAGAVLVSEALAGEEGGPGDRVVVADTHAALAILLDHFHPEPPVRPGVHPTAVLERGVVLGEGVSVGAYAVLEAGVRLGDAVVVGPHAVLGAGCQVGDGSRLHAHVVLYPGTVLGRRVRVHAGARLGVDGFGYAFVDGRYRKLAHGGRLVVADDVEVGANTTLDRGSIGDSSVGEGCKLDNLVHLAHNVRVGPHTAMAAMVGVAGSTRVGRYVMVGGQVGVSDHLSVGDRARLAGGSRVTRDVPGGETVSGYPARPVREDLRSLAHVRRIPRLVERLDALESELEALRAGSHGGRSGGDAAGDPGAEGRSRTPVDPSAGGGDGGGAG